MYNLVLTVTFFGIAAGAVPRPPLRSFKIIGGEPTDISKYPWQIELEGHKEFYCAGFLISNSWALTAAHCPTLFNITHIRAGTSLAKEGGEVVPIEKFIIHPNFDYHTRVNDISLIKLSQSITTHKATPATLPASGEAVEDDALATLIGWGVTDAGDEDFSKQLRQVQVPIVNHDTCQKAYEGNEITENMICAGLFGIGGKDVCSGDSGGPVEVDGKAVGIISWSKGCAAPDFPSVHTKVSSYIDWIKKETGLNL